MFSRRADVEDRRRARPRGLALAGLVGGVLMMAGCSGNASMTECQDDASCADAGGDGGPGTSVDAAPVSADASPDTTDAAPGALCAGVDCSDLDDPCNRGVCDPDSGQCVPQPINEDMSCAERVCGDFGACTGFEDLCDEFGRHVRTCQDLTCRAGACEVGAPYEDEGTCDRATDGITCDDPTTSCGLCGGFSSPCDETGTRTCTTTTFACGDGTCRPSSTSSSQSCSRNTDGNACGIQQCNFNQGTQQLCCNASQMCSVVCGECITPPVAPIFR